MKLQATNLIDFYDASAALPYNASAPVRLPCTNSITTRFIPGSSNVKNFHQTAYHAKVFHCREGPAKTRKSSNPDKKLQILQ